VSKATAEPDGPPYTELPPSAKTGTAAEIGGQSRLKAIIRSCLRQYTGGEAFFNALDAAIRDENVTDGFIPFLDRDSPLVVSGAFGRFFFDTYSCVFKHIHIVPGGLRNGGTCPRLKQGEELIDRDVIVLDDSLYSGKTFEAMSIAARRCGAKSVRALVVYDGSPEYRDDVSGLFRYHSEQL
jgi:hypothetical protein